MRHRERIATKKHKGHKSKIKGEHRRILFVSFVLLCGYPSLHRTRCKVPELPEVEMFVRDLRRLLTGRTIVSAQLLRPGLAETSTKQGFARSSGSPHR